MKASKLAMAAAGAFLALFAAGAAEEPVTELTNGRRIIEKANDAVRALNAIAYDVEAHAGSAKHPDQVAIVGRVTIAGEAPNGIDRFHIAVKSWEVPRINKKLENFVVSQIANEWYLVNDSDKSYVKGKRPQDLGTFPQLLAPTLLTEFSHPKPFGDELAGSVDLAGSEMVGDTDCYKITVIYASGGFVTTWYIGKKDFLPRKVDRETGIEPQRERTITTLSNLTLNPTIDDSTFRPARPEGYTDPVAASQPANKP